MRLKHEYEKRSGSKISLADLGGGLRVLQPPPPLSRKILQRKGHFWPFLGLQPPVPDRVVDKISHERLHPPPFQKILDPPMNIMVQINSFQLNHRNTIKFIKAQSEFARTRIGD